MTSISGDYHVGVDLGTTYVGAGILRDGRPEVVTLGARSAVVPSVLYFREDGDVLVGEPANRRGLTDPSRVVREFKRRVGDSTPMVVGSTPYSAEALLARLLRFVHDEVVKRQGSTPTSITVTHPANWGAYKIDVLQQAVRMADVGEVETLAEPVAAAIHYAATERLEPGGAVAVYDLGGGTFDAAVVRRTVSRGLGVGGGAEFELLGDVEGIERLGGIDLDEAVFQYVVRWCESAFGELDPDEPSALQAIARVRQECVAAKEALSADTDVAIPVVLPNLQTEVRLTRGEFEAMIRPLLQQTVEALRRAVRSADVDVGDLAAVLLVGGSSQIPLVAEMVGADLGRPIAVDQHPKHTVALGAAIAGGEREGAMPADQVFDRAAPVSDPVEASGPMMSGLAGSAASASVQSGSDSSGSSATSVLSGGPLDSLIDDVSVTSREKRTEQWRPPPETRSSGLGDGRTDTVAIPSFRDVNRRDPVVSGGVLLGGESFVRADAGGPPGAGGPSGGKARAGMVVGALALAFLAIGGAVWALTQRGSTSDPDSNGELAGETDLRGDEDPAAPEASSTTETTVDVNTTEVAAGDTTTSTTAASTTTFASSTTTTTTAVAGFSATITDITINGDRYAVSYSTNFSPLISSDPASTHLHFFFDTVPVGQAGVPGGGPWILYDGPDPFTGYGPADRPSGATQMCVTAANHAHEVLDPALYHCVDLPDE
ncbi:MAG: Hsp70 family protein [Acidimicrobiia bacterium]|nr:Hsp70 family protein [Acidimicrobiia bacterium]